MKPAWHDVIATLAEVTSAPAPELAKKQADARLRLLSRRAPTLVWSTDAELRLTSCLGVGLEGLDVDVTVPLPVPLFATARVKR